MDSTANAVAKKVFRHFLLSRLMEKNAMNKLCWRNFIRPTLLMLAEKLAEGKKNTNEKASVWTRFRNRVDGVAPRTTQISLLVVRRALSDYALKFSLFKFSTI